MVDMVEAAWGGSTVLQLKQISRGDKTDVPKQERFAEKDKHTARFASRETSCYANVDKRI
jgi:hypothetical protein